MNVAMSIDPDSDQDVEIVPIPLDRATRRRLVRFAKATGQQPIHAAAQILGAALADEKFYAAARREGRLH